MTRLRPRRNPTWGRSRTRSAPSRVAGPLVRQRHGRGERRPRHRPPRRGASPARPAVARSSPRRPPTPGPRPCWRTTSSGGRLAVRGRRHRGRRVAAACDGAALLWLESPTNPLLDVADVAPPAQPRTRRGRRVVRRQHLRTPIGDPTARLGADVVVHSATKQIAGHSDVLLGVAVTRDPERATSGSTATAAHGAVPGPFEAFLALRGLRTLPLRRRAGHAVAPAILASGSRRTPRSTAGALPGLAGRPRPRRRAAPVGRLRLDAVRSRCAGGAADADARLRAAALGRTRPASAGSSRPSSAAAAGRPRARTCPSRCCGCRSASRTSRTCGPTSSGCALGRRRCACRAGLATGQTPSALASRDISRPSSPWRDAVVDDRDDLLGDRHVDAVLAGELEDRHAGLDAFAGLPGRRGVSSTDMPRRGSRRTSGCGTAATSRWRPGRRCPASPENVMRVGAERHAEAHHLGQPPGDERGLGVVAEPHARPPCRWPAR